MSNNINAILYGRNLFGFDDNKINQQQLNDVRNSGFNTVIFWPLDITPDGDLIYHDDDSRDPNMIPIVKGGQFNQQTYGYLPPFAKWLKSGGAITKVLFGIGGAGPGAFDNAKKLLATPDGTQKLLNSFQALIKALSLDGFDFDLEVPGGNYFDYTDTVVVLTLMLTQKCNVAVTYCPYQRADFWVKCLAEVFRKNNNKQAVSWFNLQCYDGGAGNDRRIVAEWITPIRNSPSPVGIANPAAFVIPGFWSLNIRFTPHCKPDASRGILCPSELGKKFAGLKQSDPGIAGGFVWNFRMIEACANSGNCAGDQITVKAYAQAVINGLR